MTLRVLALGACLALLATIPAAAQDAGGLGGWTSREDAAKAAGAGTRAKALDDENQALKADNAELRAGRDAALKLVEITERVLAAQERLAQLADQERDAWKDKAERLEKERGKGRLWLLIQARGAMGGLLCSPAGLTGVGIPIVAGCALAGGIAGAIEAWVSGP